LKRHYIADKIRELRKNKNLSLEELAKLTGFTKGYISRIENSLKPPPIYTLSRISTVLGVDVSDLLSNEPVRVEPLEIVINRSHEHFITDGRGTPYGYVYEALAQKKIGKNMEPFFITVSNKKGPPFQHEGEEFLYVLEGTLEFYFKDKTIILKKGDSIYFDSALPHGGRSLGKTPAKMLIVIYSYRRM